MKLQSIFLSVLLVMLPTIGQAQLSTNPDKFLGNITTSGQVDYGAEKFYQLWNQITPENESKWSSIEGSRRGSFNWSGCDAAYNYAKQHHFPFKFHCLIWGQQYPGWLDNLSTAQQYKAIEEWMDAIKARYPSIDLIDVVNEAVPGHNPAPYKDALGGDGKTGYDWIIKAFEMAYERWPDAILIYNDFNTFQWQRAEFIDLVRILRNAGAPIDAYGCQSHDLTDMNVTNFKSAMNEIQSALKMPMFSSEYDIGTEDDALQEQRYKEQIPYMWEADYCAGITFWGYIYGHTWVTNGNSGIIRNGVDRPAMTWLRDYMASAKAKTAKSPFPGMKKEASVYVKPSTINATKDEPISINVRARMRTKTIERIDLYAGNTIIKTFTEAPYETEYTPSALGKVQFKAVVTTTDGSTYERLSGITVYNPRAPFKGVIALPGTIQSENFDMGAEGDAYHDSDSNNQGTTAYRNDGSGVDVVSKNGGYAIGYTNTGEWLEYTVNVAEAGYYEFDAYAAAGDNNNDGTFRLDLSRDGKLTPISDVLPIHNTSNWNTLKAIHGRTLIPLEAGEQRIRFTVVHSGFDIDRIVFKRIEVNNDMSIALSADPAPATVNTYTNISVAITPEDLGIKNVKYYVDGVLAKTSSTAPYDYRYRPTATGTYVIKAVATDADDRLSPVAAYTLKVQPKRTPFKGTITIPGIIEAENFDKGGEGFTFHDSNSEDEAKTNYRSDNGGVDIGQGNGGYVIGYTNTNEWLEYSVNVTEPGKYAFEATVSSGVSGSGFTIGLVNGEQVTTLARITVPKTGDNDWGTYKVVKGNLSRQLETGPQIIRITITGSSCNIDKVELKCTLNTGVEDIATSTKPQTIYDLSGRRVANSSSDTKLPRGIYIINGKKIAVK